MQTSQKTKMLLVQYWHCVLVFVMLMRAPDQLANRTCGYPCFPVRTGIKSRLFDEGLSVSRKGTIFQYSCTQTENKITPALDLHE